MRINVLIRHSFFVFAFILFFIPPVYSEDSAEEIIRELDARYYYPQNRGLRRLSVRIEWQQLDTVTDSGRYLKNPDVEFNWETTAAGALGNFQISGKSFEISDARKRDLKKILINYRDVMVPQTLQERVSGYQGEVKFSRNQKKLIQFVPKDPENNIQKYEFYADLERGYLPKLNIRQSNFPREVKSEIRYVQKEGKWLVAESRSQFRLGEVDYNETTQYAYSQVNGFWLLSKMTQTVRSEDKTVQSFIFRFHDYRIN